MERYNAPDIVNIGTGTDITISELTAIIAEATEYRGEISYDSSKPDGTPEKRLDISKITSLGWNAKTALGDGIRRSYEWYIEQFFSL